MKWTPERKVGVFTIIGIAVFINVALFLSNISIFSPPEMTIVGRFQTVTGLKDGNTVRYSGVPIGKVTNINVSPDGVLVTMKVKKNVRIPMDSNFSLQTDGLLGEKFVSINPGHSESMLSDDAIITGQGKNEMDTAIDQMSRVLTQVEKLVASLNAVVGNEQSQESMRVTIQNAAIITNNLANATHQMNALLAQNSNNVSAIATNMAELTNNMNHITQQLEATLKVVDNNGEAGQNIREILSNLKETTDSLKVMSQNMETVIGNKETAADLQKTIHNAAHLTSVLSAVTGGEGGMNTQMSMDMLYNRQQHLYDPNLQMKLQYDKNILALGANHIGNGTTIEANVGREIAPKVTTRAGMFDGQVGIGLDYGLVNNPVTLSVAAFNPNNPAYRIRGEVKLFNNVKAVAQFNRPYSSEYGGNYYGVQYNF